MAYIRVLMELDAQCPPKGLEMSIVLESVCRSFRYPTPFELHFSNAHKEKCMANLEKYCLEMHGADKDLAAHFTVVRKVGMTLCGKNISEVFGAVPKEDYIDSIKSDVADAIEEIGENLVYIILNLCRVLAYIKDDAVLSKKQGAQWGIENLPAEYSALITSAENSYRLGLPFQSAGEEASHSFAKYMLQQIFKK